MSVEAIQALSMTEQAVSMQSKDVFITPGGGMAEFPDLQKIEQAVATSVQSSNEATRQGGPANAAMAIENSVFGKGLNAGPMQEIAAAVEAGVPMTQSFMMASQLAMLSFQTNFTMVTTASKEVRKAKTELQSEGRQG
ncbi:MAG: hypothetical protein ACRDAM_05495 [Casimicrobium sp.]